MARNISFVYSSLNLEQEVNNVFEENALVSLAPRAHKLLNELLVAALLAESLFFCCLDLDLSLLLFFISLQDFDVSVALLLDWGAQFRTFVTVFQVFIQ